jgi:hypothetical protein
LAVAIVAESEGGVVMGKIQETIMLRTSLIGSILWVALFALGLAKTIWAHEWPIALFCGVFLVMGLVRLFRALRSHGSPIQPR